MPRVDYSELVKALNEGNKEKVDSLLMEVIPRLEEYLCVVMGADETDSQECVQQAFLDVYEQIQKDNIREEKYIFSYLLKACRHEYLRYMKQQHRFVYEEDTLGHMVEPAEQFQNLLDLERQQILEECLEELDKPSRNLIIFFINNPDATTKDASKKFNLTGANVRTRKSRITNILHHCYKTKSQK